MPRGYVLSHYAKYATDTVRVSASSTHSAWRDENAESDVQLSAYQRKSVKTTTVDQQVKTTGEDSYSVVIYDRRTGASGQTSLRVNLPAGFTAAKVYGIISDTNQRHAPLEVVLNPDGNSADFTLPVNAIVSVKFVK